MSKKIMFGSGSLFGINSVANSTPAQFAALQSVGVDISFSTKELFGQHNFPITVARGTGKITCKAQNATFQARAFNDLFFSDTLQSGNRVLVVLDEAGAIPATTTYTVTVANAATFSSDLGVIDGTTGMLMAKVATGPAAGQYSVDAATGIYTFAAADASKPVKISYQYNIVSGGSTIIINQQLIGVAPKFKAIISTKYDGQQIDLQLNACVATKLAFTTAQEDFAKPDFEFSCFADDTGEVGRWIFPDAD